MGLTRFGVSIDSRLLERFDKAIRQRGYNNRSEAFRDLIRDSFVREDTDKGTALMVGTVTIIYNHHEMELPKSLAQDQHDHHDMVLSSVHVHLDAHNCMEVILLKGRGRAIREFGDRIISRKGVKHGKVTLTEADF